MNQFIRHTLLAIPLAISTLPALAQVSAPFQLEGKLHYGYLAVHREGVQNLVQNHMAPFELNYLKRGDGSKPWHHYYNGPEWGASLFYCNFANPEELGWGIGVSPVIKFRMVEGPRLGLGLQMGWGLGYVSKVFDRQSNYKNLMIGSHLNVFVSTQVEGRYRLSDKSQLSVGLSAAHFSNAAFKMPNLGYNIVTAFAGYRHQIGTRVPDFEASAAARSKSWQYSGIFAVGRREVPPLGGERYPAGTMMLKAMKPLGNKSRLGTGADFFYDESLESTLLADSVIVDSKSDFFQLGVNLAYAIRLNRYEIVVETGYYLRTLTAKDGLVYHRIGGRIALAEHLLLNLTLKSHYGKADYFELGLGYRISRE